MWPLTHQVQTTFDNIKKDLASFANSGTLSCFESENWLEATWQERQLSKKAKFVIERNRVSVHVDDSKLDYTSFLASPYMADLRYSANQILALTPPCEYFVEPFVSFNDDVLDNISNEANKHKFSDTVRSIALSPIQNTEGDIVSSTRLIFVRGAAGIGKTVAVTELVRNQAKAYLAGKQDFIYLYINAQGRALARIEEAMALDVQKSGFSFFQSAVNALARNGLVIPIIDGFDELIGSGGFADAFKSLSSFLATLEQQGTVIATGRSTFYDANVLSYAAGLYSHSDTLNYDFCTISLTQWTETEIQTFFDLSFNEHEYKNEICRSISNFLRVTSDRNKQLISKPFYSAQLAELITARLEEQQSNTTPIPATILDFEDKDLVEYLITFYLDREKEKFKNRTGQPILDTAGHRTFLQQLSLELWWQEKRSVDKQTLQVVTEYVIEATNMLPEDQPIFTGKVESYALLQSNDTSTGKEYSFESDVYFDYFLMGAFIEILENDPESYLKQFLSRSLFGETFLEYFYSHSRVLTNDEIAILISKICNSCSKTSIGSLARRNGGAAVCSILEERIAPENLTIRDIEGYGVSLSNLQMRNATILNCTFRDLKLYHTQISESRIINCTLSDIYMSNDTRFDQTNISSDTNFINIILENTTFYDPQDKNKFLMDRGCVGIQTQSHTRTMNQDQRDIYTLLTLLYEKTRRKLYFDLDLNNEPTLSIVIRTRHWPVLLKILLQSGVLEKKHRDRAGTSQFLYRLTVQKDSLYSCLQDGTTCNIKALTHFSTLFWNL